MPSQARDSRAEERRLSIRTLAIASAASATSAIVTSRLWTAGTPIAAATTPVLVTIVSEMLHKPTAKIAERFTVETDALPQATGSGAPPPAAEPDAEAEPVREQPMRETSEGVKVYRARGATRRRLSWKVIAATAALAFVIGLAVLTLPRVIAGHSLLEGSPPGFATAGQKKKDTGQSSGQDGGQDGNQTQQPQSTSPDSTITSESPSPGRTPEVTPAPEEQTTPTETTPEATTPQGTPIQP